MCALVGKKVVILSGPNKGKEGYVVSECKDAVAIRALEMFGADGWYGRYYALKSDVREST